MNVSVKLWRSVSISLEECVDEFHSRHDYGQRLQSIKVGSGVTNKGSSNPTTCTCLEVHQDIAD
jgi:hypothetical protein